MKYAIKSIMMFAVLIVLAIVATSCTDSADRITGASEQKTASKTADYYRQMETVAIPVVIYPHSTLTLTAYKTGLAEIRSIVLTQNDENNPNESSTLCDDLTMYTDEGIDTWPLVACNSGTIKTQEASFTNHGKRVLRLIANVTGPLKHVK